MSDRPVIDFDHHSPEYARNVFPLTKKIRATCPFGWTEAHGGYWVATRYEDIMTIARDVDTFINGRIDGRSSVYVPTTPTPIVPLETDPPIHTAIRRLLNPIFSTKMAQAWEPFVRETADALIDGFIERGSAELCEDLARGVTFGVNLALVGMPNQGSEIRAQMDAQGVIVRAKPGSPEYIAAQEAIESLARVTVGLLADRRQNPRQDVATAIVNLKIDGEAPGDDLLVHLIQDVISGGNGTTSSLIAHSLLWLGEHPAERARLAADPSMLPDAVEEFLRFFSVGSNLCRAAAADTVVAGQQVRKQEQVLLCYASANRDEAVFDNPDEVQLDRKMSDHLAFGFGRHRCVGQHIARMTARVVLQRVLERLPDYEVQHEGVRHYETTPIVRGMTSLPVRFTPGRKVGATIPTEGPPLPDRLNFD